MAQLTYNRSTKNQRIAAIAPPGRMSIPGDDITETKTMARISLITGAAGELGRASALHTGSCIDINGGVRMQ